MVHTGKPPAALTPRRLAYQRAIGPGGESVGGELQPPRLDLAHTLNERDGRADAATAQALGQRPKLVRAIRAAQEDQIPKVDSRGRQCGQVKLSVRITPGNRATVFLRCPGKQ